MLEIIVIAMSIIVTTLQICQLCKTYWQVRELCHL